MGCAASQLDNSYADHPPLLEEHVYQLNLPAPPINGFDSMMTLAWCRDLNEEREEAIAAEKASKKKKSKETIPPPPKKYYLCLRCKYSDYGEENKTINLQKGEKPYQHLPKWDDPDFMEDILINGPFYQNDAFLLEHVPTAIRLPSGYAYVDQFKKAFLHHNGIAAPPDQIYKHQLRVAKKLWGELYMYQKNSNRDAKGRERSRTVKKLQDILTSMEFDAEILKKVEIEVQTETEVADAKEVEKDAKAAKTDAKEKE
jgi:hypothetical protein